MADVYLAFDDGPYKGSTDDVLDALRAKQATATFFLQMRRQADRAEQFRMIRRMLDEGHSIGNHGVDHDPMTQRGYKSAKPPEVQTDFEENRTILEKMFRAKGETFPGFQVARLPGDGRFQSVYVDMIVDKLHIPHASWDMEFSPNGRMAHVNNSDWQGIKGVAATRKDLPKEGNILLLHDLHWRGQGPLLSRLIETLQRKYTVRSMVPVPSGLRSVRYASP